MRWGSPDSSAPTPLVDFSLSTCLPPSPRALNSQSQDQPTHPVMGGGAKPTYGAPQPLLWPPGGSHHHPGSSNLGSNLSPTEPLPGPSGAACPPEQCPHLRVPTRSQCLPAALTAQARPVPVLAQRRHLLGWEGGESNGDAQALAGTSPRLGLDGSLTKVDPLVAARTHVGFPGECGDTGGWGQGWRGVRSAQPRCSHTNPRHTEPSPPLLGPFGGPLAFRSSVRATGTSMGPVTCGPSEEGFS